MNEQQRQGIRAELAGLFESVTRRPLEPGDITTGTYQAWYLAEYGRDISHKFAQRRLGELVRAGELVRLEQKRTDPESGQAVWVWQKKVGGAAE